MNPDGGNLRNVAKRGLGVAWSPDSRWIYYSEAGVAYKVPVDGGTAMRVRPGPARNVIGVAGGTIYFMVDWMLTDGSPGFEIHAATPEDGPSRVLARIPPSWCSSVADRAAGDLPGWRVPGDAAHRWRDHQCLDPVGVDR